jgi:predicted ATPase
MAVKSIAIRNYRAFVDVPPVELGPINVLVGPNNGGKSSLISALYLMQIGSDSNTRDVRVASGNPQAEIDIGLVDVPEIRAWNADEDVTLSMKLRPGAFEIKLGPNRSVQQLPEAEPDHFIVPSSRGARSPRTPGGISARGDGYRANVPPPRCAARPAQQSSVSWS